MAFDATLFATLTAQGVPAEAAAQAANKPDAPAQTPPPVTFTPPPLATYAPAPGTPQDNTPQPEAARGTVEDFWNQPTGSNGGKGASSYFGGKDTPEKPEGAWLQFTVDRDITGNDVQQMTKYGTHILETWQFGPQAGKPKFQLVVPATVVASGDGTHGQFFEGGAMRLYLKPGPVSDAFRAALQAGGEPSGFPKGGSTVVMVKAGKKQNKSGNPTQLYDFTYTAPNGVPATVQAEVASAPPTAPATVPAPGAPAPSTAATPPAQAPAPAASDGQSELEAKKAALLAELNGLQS